MQFLAPKRRAELVWPKTCLEILIISTVCMTLTASASWCIVQSWCNTRQPTKAISQCSVICEISPDYIPCQISCINKPSKLWRVWSWFSLAELFPFEMQSEVQSTVDSVTVSLFFSSSDLSNSTRLTNPNYSETSKLV